MSINTRPCFSPIVVLISVMLLIAVNLRPAITDRTVIGPHSGRSCSVEVVGMLTTIPFVLFGLAGVLAGPLGNRIGFARAIGGGLVILAAGCFLRSWEASGTDLERTVGSILIGAGIAIGNVLMPELVNSRLPNRVGIMTSMYSTGSNLGGSFGIEFAVPLAVVLGGGWNASLAFWGYAALSPC